MRLLVTGASGLLGSAICQLAIQENHEVHSAYNRHKPRQGTPIKLDITDKKAINNALKKTEPDVVVHCAALSDVDKCELEKRIAWRTNVKATSNIADQCARQDIFVVYVSTDYVFDGKKGNYEETDTPNPVNYYGLTKLEGETILEVSNAHHCTVRTSVIYGSTPAAGKINFALWLIGRLKEKKKTKIVFDQWNSPTLNTNLAEMIMETIDRKLAGTFHLAGATRLSRLDFAEKTIRTFNLNKNYLLPTPSREIAWIARRPEDTSLSTEKARLMLKHKPLNINEALARLKIEMSREEACS